LFQEYVSKSIELRITVVGDVFLAAAIHSQESKMSKIDWRRYDLDHTPHSPFELPSETKLKLRAFLDHFGLVFGAIDCVLRPDGEIVFLEVNPGGQWLWIEELTMLPIADSIAAYLADHANISLRKLNDAKPIFS